jgi:hypothetical protein
VADPCPHGAECGAPRCGCPRIEDQRWTAEQIERAGRHLGPSATRIALAIVDVLRHPPPPRAA